MAEKLTTPKCKCTTHESYGLHKVARQLRDSLDDEIADAVDASVEYAADALNELLGQFSIDKTAEEMLRHGNIPQLLMEAISAVQDFNCISSDTWCLEVSYRIKKTDDEVYDDNDIVIPIRDVRAAIKAGQTGEVEA